MRCVAQILVCLGVCCVCLCGYGARCAIAEDMAPEQDMQVVETDDLQEDEPLPQVMALSTPTPMLAAAANTLTTGDLNNIWNYNLSNGSYRDLAGTNHTLTNKAIARQWLTWREVVADDNVKVPTLYGFVVATYDKAYAANSNASSAKTAATQAKTAAENATTKASNAYDKAVEVKNKLDATYTLLDAVDKQTQTNETKLNELKQSIQSSSGTVELSDEQYDALQQSLATNLLALTISLGVLALILGAIVGIAITMHWRAGRG